jgi:hypothetical protein
MPAAWLASFIHLEGNSLIQARLKAAVDGGDTSAPFVEGHEACAPDLVALNPVGPDRADG